MRVLITGGNRGLGLQLVKVFLKNGCSIKNEIELYYKIFKED